MKIPNPQQLSAQELLPRIQERYPQAVLKKPLFTKGIVMVQMQGWRMFVRPFRRQLLIDFQPPVLWTILGIIGTALVVSLLLSLLFGGVLIAGWLVGVLAFLGVKAVWQKRQRDTLERFRLDVEQAAMGLGGVL